ncbi:hypothetical protein ACFL38_01710 [Candidatus Omnitrophota bacterium]
MDDKKHRAGIAVVLSFLFSGLGQLYVGKIRRGLMIMSISAVSMIFIIVGAVLAGHWLLTMRFPRSELVLGLALLLAGIIAAGIAGVYSIYNAYKEALE